MCFSAEASFAGALLLTGVGCATIKTSLNNKDHLLWAAIPLFFAVQQACEGLVWLDLRGEMAHAFLTISAKNLFIFFAYAFWPIWIPLSLYVSEPQAWKKKIIFFLLGLGIIVAFLSLWDVLPGQITPHVVGHSIQYGFESPFYKNLIYLAAVSIPLLISSLRRMWIFGVAVILSCLFAKYFYVHAFTSVWCFFGALLSAILYLVARSNDSNPK